MSLSLQVGPRRRRRKWKLYLVLVLLILILGGAVAWQRGWLPEKWFTDLQASQVVADLKEEVVEHAPPQLSASLNLEAESSSSAVVQVASEVVESPNSPAYTAELYLESGEHQIPWPNAGGRTKVQTYTVQSGDSLWGIAYQFDLDLETLRWSNPELEQNPDLLVVGTELVILPVQGAYHRVQPGETIETIAAQYGVAATDITHYPPNALYPPYEFQAGHGLIIPFGRKELLLPKPSLSSEEPLAWPTVSDYTASDTQSLDFETPQGATVYAAEKGTITAIQEAEDGSYTLVIEHDNGLFTRYSYLESVWPTQEVARGTPLGRVSDKFRFAVLQNDQAVNPLDYLSNIPQ